MSTSALLAWVVLPYVAFALLISGLIWRYKKDQYGWTSRSSQWHESAILRWSSPLFHFGILFVAAGHIVGLLIPKSWTEAVGVPEHLYHLGAVSMGSVAGAMDHCGPRKKLVCFTVVSWLVACARPPPLTTRSCTCCCCCRLVWVLTPPSPTQLFGPHGGYDYRETVSPWLRSISCCSLSRS